MFVNVQVGKMGRGGGADKRKNMIHVMLSSKRLSVILICNYLISVCRALVTSLQMLKQVELRNQFYLGSILKDNIRGSRQGTCQFACTCSNIVKFLLRQRRK